MKESFFTSNNIEYLLQRSKESDRFANTLFLYALVDDDLMESLLAASYYDSYIRTMILNLYYLLNSESFTKLDQIQLTKELRSVFNVRARVLELMSDSELKTDYHLYSLFKLFDDIYLIHKARSQVHNEEIR